MNKGVGLLVDKVVSIIKVDVDGAVGPDLERVGAKLVFNFVCGAVDPVGAAHMDSTNGWVVGDLLCDKGELAGDVELVGLAEKGVERLGGACGGGRVVREHEGGDEGGALGTGSEGGLVEKVGIFDVFCETLEEGEGLIEYDGERYAGEVFADRVVNDGPEVRAVGRVGRTGCRRRGA